MRLGLVVFLLIPVSTILAFSKTHIATQGGGEPATPHQYPWVIRLDAVDEYAKTDKTKTKLLPYTGHTCGGALLLTDRSNEESDIVLTAAHCMVKYVPVPDPENKTKLILIPTSEPIPLSKRRAVAGAHSISLLNETGSEVRQIVRLENHPTWTPTSTRKGNDIAVIKLDKPIQFSDTIKPIRLPEKGDRPEEGAKCVIAGWGQINDTASPEELYHMEVKVMGTCVKSPETGHCVHPIDNSLPSACPGDSGGPLFCKRKDEWIQYGVLSYGPGDCEKSIKTGPSVYMNTEVYLDWIHETIREWRNVSEDEK